MSEPWADLRLGDVSLKIGSGATPKGGKEAYLDHGPFTLIRSQNIYNDRFAFSGLAYINDEQARSLNNVAVEADDVLLNITGDSVARCAQVDPSVLPARVNQHVAIIRPDPSRLDARFLRYYLVSPAVQRHLHQLASAGATRPALTKAMLESLSVFAPASVNEQRVISSVLGSLDDKIELNRQMSATLEAMARALFTSWFVDFDHVMPKAERQDTVLCAEIDSLFTKGFEPGNEELIPVGWHWRAASEVLDLNPSRSLAGVEVAPYLDMASVPTQGFAIKQVIQRRVSSGSRFTNGDTLLARITPCLENGKTAFVDFLHEGEVAWGSTEFIVLRPREPLPAEYGYLLARDETFRAFAIGKMTGSSGRQRVPVDAFDSYFLASPPDAVARAFADIVIPFFKRMTAANSESRTLAALRDALLPKLMSGELRVTDAERILERSA